MALSNDHQRQRDRLWERLREKVSATKEGNLFFPGEPDFFDVRDFAAKLVKEFPDTGLRADQVAVEFHRLWRAAFRRGPAEH